MGNRNSVQSAMNSDQKKYLNWIFIATLAVLSILFYYNSLENLFSYRDKLVGYENPLTMKGLKGIPEIFSSPLEQENNQFPAYRPLGRTSFAVEYQFTAESKNLPRISHLINLLLYLLGGLLLFRLLKRMFQNGNPWFPFLISALFLAHPIHTEVVASLANRDILLGFIFSLLAAIQFFKWVDTGSNKPLFFGLLSYFFALFSHESAVAQVLLIPLMLYFFSGASKAELVKSFLALTGVAFLSLIIPFTLFSETGNGLLFYENPLVNESSFLARLSSVFFSLGFYLKMLAVPYPLSFYYGYDVIPLTNWDSFQVWLSFAIYAAIFVIALINFKKKKLISFILLLFLISILPYSNLISLIPGIVGERFLFVPSLAFSMFVVWLLFILFKIKIDDNSYKTVKLFVVSIIILLLIIPAGILTHERNKAWASDISLYRTDVKTYPNSAFINNLIGRERMKPVIIEMAKPVTPYKFILPDIKEVENFSKQAVSIDSTLAESWERLGYVNAEIHGWMAIRRMESFLKQKKDLQAEQEEGNAQAYIELANQQYDKALQSKPIDSAFIYYRKAKAYRITSELDKALENYQIAMKLEPSNRQYEAEYIENLLYSGRYKEAISQNELFSQKYPDSDIPDINLGGYYYFRGDTVTAVSYYEKAIEKGTKRPEVGKLLYYYYKGKGNAERANYFMMKSYEAEKNTPAEK